MHSIAGASTVSHGNKDDGCNEGYVHESIDTQGCISVSQEGSGRGREGRLNARIIHL